MKRAARRIARSCVVLGTLAAVFLVANPAYPTAPREQKEAARRTVKVPATVEAAQQVRLFAAITGYVQKTTIDIGDRVKKGQILAELAVPEKEAELAQKKALVVQAEAEVQQAHGLHKEATAVLAITTARVQEAEATVKAAQAQLKFRERQLERLKELLKNSAIDERLVDEATAKVEAARAALTEAESKLRTAKAARERGTARLETAEVGVKVAQARREVAKADLEHVAVQLEFARIRAPFDGIVTLRSISSGDFAGPPQGRAVPLFVVARVDTVRVVVAVPAADAVRLQIGAEATVAVDALPGRVFKGKVARMAGSLDPTKRTLRAEIDLPNPEGRLMPGMYGTVTLVLG